MAKLLGFVRLSQCSSLARRLLEHRYCLLAACDADAVHATIGTYERDLSSESGGQQFDLISKRVLGRFAEIRDRELAQFRLRMRLTPSSSGSGSGSSVGPGSGSFTSSGISSENLM